MTYELTEENSYALEKYLKVSCETCNQPHTAWESHMNVNDCLLCDPPGRAKDNELCLHHLLYIDFVNRRGEDVQEKWKDYQWQKHATALKMKHQIELTNSKSQQIARIQAKKREKSKVALKTVTK